jgi:xanthine dehydrogenase YagS FAD-binding subunit
VKLFDFTGAATVEEAVRSAGPGAKFLAGGTNLVDLMRYDVERPDKLIDVSHLALAKIEPTKDGGLAIGALVRNSDLAADKRIKKDYAVLSQALLNGASPQLRNMATTGGNLLQRTRCSYFYDTAFPCNKREPGSGCPAIHGVNRMHAILGQSDSCIAVHPSDMAVAMAMLDAVVHVQSANGSRAIPIAELHRLPGATPEVDTTLLPGELITAVHLPHLPIAANSHYVKVRDRASYAFALVSVAAAITTDGSTIKAARFALGGVAHKPWRSLEAEHALTGKPANAESFRHAAEIALRDAKGSGGNDFKIELAKRTVVKAFMDIVGGKGRSVPGGLA